MPNDEKRQCNRAAYRRLKPSIDMQYPAGHFISIDEGDVLADAGDFPSLVDEIQKRGKRPQDVLIVQAGVDYPEESVIF